MFSIGSKKIPCISVGMDAIKYVVTLLIPILTASLCSAQQSRINGQQKIVLPATSIRFDSLLSIVGRQTGAKFSLNTSKFPPSRLIHVPKGPMPLAKLLAAIRDDTGIYYTSLGGHIIFIDNPPRKSSLPPAKKAAAAREAKNKSTAEKVQLKRLSAKKIVVPAIARESWELAPIPGIYFVTDTPTAAKPFAHTDSADFAVAPAVQSDAIKKTDSVQSVFVYVTSLKKTDSVKMVFGRITAKEPGTPSTAALTSADGAYHQRPRLTGCHPDPYLQWGWGRKKDDTLIHKIVAVGGTDSMYKEQQAAAITKSNLLTAATINTSKQAETATATTSPDDKIKSASASSTKNSLVKSILQNTFSNHYQRPAGQGVRRSGERPFSFLLNTGVTADEVYYANPTVQIGLPFLYGIASYSTNFNLVSFRVGAGIAVRLSDDWRLHAQGTTGRQLADFSFSDTIGQSLSGRINSRLLKFSLVAERKVGEHFRVQAGLVFNNQRTKYIMDNDADPLSVADMDKIYHQMNIIHAPYTISNIYGDKQNIKTWIGFQVGIFYNINFNKRK
jgi:hypothetical protein